LDLGLDIIDGIGGLNLESMASSGVVDGAYSLEFELFANIVNEPY